MFELDSLNEEQKRVVLTNDGVVCCTAVAGSGKTYAMTHKVAYLVESDGGEMSDLKPCPFCGSEAIVPAMPIGITDDDTPVECTNMDCNASDVTFDKGAWNTRPIEDALRKEIAQLQADNRSLVEQLLKAQEE